VNNSIIIVLNSTNIKNTIICMIHMQIVLNENNVLYTNLVANQPVLNISEIIKLCSMTDSTVTFRETSNWIGQAISAII